MGDSESSSGPAQSPDQTLTCAASDPSTQNASGSAGSSSGVCGPPNSTPADTPPVQKGHIAVQVRDCSGAAMQGINVSVLGMGWNGVTDASGTFDFGDVTPGNYTVTGLQTGNSTPAAQTLAVPPAQTTLFNLVICAIRIEIQINNTGAASDDIVQLKCAHPAHRHKVPCQIRLTSGAAHDHPITLGNPDGRLRFPEAGDATKNVTLPAGGAWVAFEISGENSSAAIGDAVIEARLAAVCPDHGASSVGDLKGTKPGTVFWFDAAEIKVTAGGTYSISGGQFTATGGNGVNYSAKATIKPSGVDCSAPQVTNLRVGILQNALAATPRRDTTWSNPSITWASGVPAGTIVTIANRQKLTINRPSTANDSTSLVQPLYDQPGKAGPTGTLDPNSLQPPMGCAGGAAATSFDTPSTPIPPPLTVPAVTAAGTAVGTVTYTFERSKLDTDFIIWAVIFNTTNNQVCAVRERTWGIHVDTSAAGTQQCSPAASDTAPATDPVTAPPFSNDVVNDPANRTQGPVPGPTTQFTK